MAKGLMEKILVDSCIFIDIFRGDKELFKYISTLNIVINPIVYMKLLQGCQDKKELTKVDRFLNQFEIKQINEKNFIEIDRVDKIIYQKP